MPLLIVGLVSIPVLVVLLARPVERRLALRYPRRRPVEASLVVLGALLGTGIITGSLVVGDTIDRSIRAQAYDQLGPIDQLVSVSGLDRGAQLADRLAALDHPDVDGVFAFASAPAAVTGAGSRPLGQPRAQLIELDFEEASTFGGDPAATGIAGPTPAPGHAAVTVDLATRLDVEPGDAIVVYAYGQTVELEVDRVLARTGLAGFWQLDPRRQSFNVLVAPGLLAQLSGAAVAVGAEPPTVHVAISNLGGVEDGAARTDAVTEAAEAALTGFGARVQPVKLDTLDEATEAADSLTQLYFTLGMFAVAAGVLLLVNIFVMLTDDRRGEMGMMRALGLRRLPLVRAYATEGWLYSLAGGVLGAVLGIGFGRVIAWRANSILQQGDEVFALELTFAWTWPTVLRGAAIGFLISLATILVTSARVSRLNVIAAIRDLPTIRRRRPRRRLAWLGLVAVVAGIAWTITGIAGPNAYGIIIGPMLAVVGLLPVVGRYLPQRPVAAVVAVAVLAWGAVFPWALGGLDVDITIPLFLVQGITMAGAAVTLVTLFQDGIGHRLAWATRGSLGVRLGLAYPVARRFRTAMTLGMFAVVILTLVYIAILSHMFSEQVDEIADDLTGGFGIVVTSNPTDPLRAEDLAATPGVTAVAPLGYGVADFTRPDDPQPVTWFVTGFGPEFAEAPIAMKDAGPYSSAEEAFTAVLNDPDLVIVDEFFLVTGAGPPSSTFKPGDTVTIIDRVSGRSRDLTIAALAEADFLLAGAYLGQDAFSEVFGERAVPSRFYVGADLVTPGAAEATVDTIRRDFLANGADAETVLSRVETLLAQNTGFFTLMQQFVGVGLVVGIAGIAVILVRAVRERRREVGVLRSLGFQPRSVAVAFLVEASFVAIEGVVIGVAVALIGSYGLVASGNNFTEGFSFVVPWGGVGFIVAIAVVASAIASLWPALRASRIRPAAALRVSD